MNYLLVNNLHTSEINSIAPSGVFHIGRGGVHFLLGNRSNDDAFDVTTTLGKIKHHLIGVDT